MRTSLIGKGGKKAYVYNIKYSNGYRSRMFG